MIKYTAFALLLLLTSAAQAADNTVILTPGSGVTLRSKDIGGGVESMIQILGDTAGTPLATAPGTPNASFSLPIQGVTGGTPIATTATPSAPSTATMQSAAVASGNGTVLSTVGLGAAMLTVNCAACSGGTTVNFEGTQDNSNYVAIPASQMGSNIIATTTTQSGISIWQISVAGMSNIRARISAYSAGTVTVTGTSVTAVLSSPIVSVNAQTSGGASATGNIGAANTTAVIVKASPGTLYGAQLGNIGAVPAYLKLYNAASATCGSGTPVKRLIIPTASTAANGAGSNVDFGTTGIAFTVGITYCLTLGITDADTSAPVASTVLVNLDWK